MPCILYKLDTNSGQQHRPTSNLLPFYLMPNKDVFNTWVMYLESILKEVYSVQGSEQILLEALNLLAINIYFAEMTASDFFSGGASPLLSPGSAGLNSLRGSGRGGLGQGEGAIGNFDRDQFAQVCEKIKER